MNPSEHGQSHVAGDGRLEILGMLRFALLNWYWIVAGAVIGSGAMFGVGLLMPRVYEAEITALPVKEQPGMSSLRSLAGGYGALASLAGVSLPGSENPAEMAVVRLKSRGFLEDFIRDQGLLPEMFPHQWNAEKRTWRDDAVPPPTYQDGYQMMLRRMLRASVDKRAGTVSIKLRWTDPVKAAAWANLLVDKLNQVTRESAIDEASASVKYLTAELGNAQSVELRSSIGMLLEEQVNKRMLAVTRPDFSLKIIDAARPSDANRYVSPRPLVLVIGGVIAGSMIGAFLAFLFGTTASSRAPIRLDR